MPSQEVVETKRQGWFVEEEVQSVTGGTIPDSYMGGWM
jgi:hypothetical protein